MDIDNHVKAFCWSEGAQARRIKAPRAMVGELLEIGPPELQENLRAADAADPRSRVSSFPKSRTLTELPVGMNWLNPVVGETINRDQLNVLCVDPGGADVPARVRRNQTGGADLSLTIAGNPVILSVTLPIALAFEVAAEFARSLPKQFA
ncbi:hypothetical protein [Xanthomonas arboricola]|uniref:hypothetical protein n=1 Tax=Xanthomonas arboricola TaxID=56448 RepID=UPI001D039A8E